jgi:RNA polymerase sigma-70 factor, ECF subfamily
VHRPLRRLAVHRRALRLLRPPEAGPPPSDDTVVLVAALRELPPKQREAIVLHYLRGLAVHAIATEMGATAGTVRSWLARGRAALSMNLNEPTRSATEEGHR